MFRKSELIVIQCGGAMQRYSCPECGAPIGGTGHTLDATNTRATDLENIGLELGAAQSPFEWGRL